LDGFGNGGNAIDLTSSSTAAILSNGILDTPTYDYGRGPIKVKVVDPLNVVDGYFECKFKDYTETIYNGADTASWVIYRYSSLGGTLLDSVESDMAIGIKDSPSDPLFPTHNEQIIPEWGVSVQISQAPYYLPNGATGGQQARTTDLLESSLTFGDSSQRWLAGVQDNDAFTPFNWIRSGDYEPQDPEDCIEPGNPLYVAEYLNPCVYPDELGADADKEWAKILGGTIAPARVVGYQSSFMPLAYYNYPSPALARQNTSISFIPSVDIVLTSDKSKWTRCPIIELGRESAFNVGGAEPGEMRKSLSVDKNGNPDGTGTTGMGWFPGYAIDVESGARLYMAFGENSFLVTDNGADMKWNPSDRLVSGGYIMGGMHPVYVFGYAHSAKNKFLQGHDYPYYDPAMAEDLATPTNNQLYADMLAIEGGSSTTKRDTYGSLSWVAYPTAAPGYDISSGVPPTTATIKIRVSKEYKDFSWYDDATGDHTQGPNGGKPMYSWSMDDIMTEYGSAEQLTSVLDMINVVPNPYYAYSEYERNRLDTKVKITNLPERCTVSIYTVNGKLIRTFEKDSPITSIDWDLNNHKMIPVASGVYLIHVDVPDIGEVVLKFFGGMRQIDLQGI
jgi:hypothetical protein